MLDNLRPSSRLPRAMRWLVCGMVVLSACSAKPTRTAPKAGSAQRAAAADIVQDALPPYPRARWRLAGESLQHVVLFPSHILIRYRGLDDGTGLARYPGWKPLEAPTRTRAEARALALRLEQALRADPAQFNQLAQRYSDDTVTRPLGGALGAMAAPEIGAPLLDALAALRDGQVSRAFESGLGFHLVRKNPPPVDHRVAGDRLTIAYRTASPRYLATVNRSRQQALEMANKLLTEARRDPGSFADLVARYSDAHDTDLSLHTGVWSTREAGPAALEVFALSQVSEGELVGPIDTVYGLQILRRVAAHDAPEYAFEAVRLMTPDSVAPEKKLEAAQRIAEVTKQLAADPARFDALRLEHCCTPSERFGPSRGLPAVESALSSMAFGELRTAPVHTELETYFLRRLDPHTLQARPTKSFELPDAPPNVDHLVLFGEGSAVARGLRVLTATAGASLQLDDARSKALGKIADQLAKTLESNASEAHRKAELTRTKAALLKQLGADGYDRYMAYASAWAADELLMNHAPVAATEAAAR